MKAADALVERAELATPGQSSLALLRAVLYGHTGRPAAALTMLKRLATSRTVDGEGELAPDELLKKGRLLAKAHGAPRCTSPLAKAAASPADCRAEP